MALENTKNYHEQGGDKWVVGGTLEIKEGATVTGLAANPLTAATTSALGGVKQAANQAASTATTVADLKTNFNTLLAALKTAGIMVADA